MNRIMNLLLLEGKSQKNRTVIVWIVWRSQHWIQCQAWYCLCLCCQAFFSQKSPIFTPWLKVEHGVEFAVNMDRQSGKHFIKRHSDSTKKLVNVFDLSEARSWNWETYELRLGGRGSRRGCYPPHLAKICQRLQLLFLIWRWIWFLHLFRCVKHFKIFASAPQPWSSKHLGWPQTWPGLEFSDAATIKTAPLQNTPALVALLIIAAICWPFLTATAIRCLSQWCK